MAESRKPKRSGPRTFFLVKCALVLFAVVVLPYVIALFPSLQLEDKYRFSAHIELPPAPRWGPTALTDQVIAVANIPADASVLDPTLCEQVARSLARHPWVKEVRSVTKTPGRSLKADITYREPVAMVLVDKGYLPVDLSGVLLPPGDFSAEDIAAFPLIRKITTPPPAIPGQTWNDADLLAATALAAKLTPGGDVAKNWDRLGFLAIEPEPHRADAATLQIVSRGGSRVSWGRAPGADELEPTFDQKLGRLDQYLGTYGSLEDPRGPYRIDIRAFDVIALEPLTSRLR